MGEMGLSRVGVDVNVVSSLLGLPGEELQSLYFVCSSRMTSKVVSSEYGLQTSSIIEK